MLHKVWNNWKGTVGSSNCGCTTLTFSSLLQKASNLPNIYISETSKDFSPEDSKICFLVLWKDVWYSLNRKMQSYERFKRGIVHSETLVYEWKIQKFYPHTKLITSTPQIGAAAVNIKNSSSLPTHWKAYENQ